MAFHYSSGTSSWQVSHSLHKQLVLQAGCQASQQPNMYMATEQSRDRGTRATQRPIRSKGFQTGKSVRHDYRGLEGKAIKRQAKQEFKKKKNRSLAKFSTLIS